MLKNFWLVFIFIALSQTACRHRRPEIQTKAPQAAPVETEPVSQLPQVPQAAQAPQAAPAWVFSSTSPVKSDAALLKEINRCVETFDNARLFAASDETLHLQLWRACSPVENRDPSSCSEIKNPDDATLCKEDYFFYSVLVSVTQNDFQRCVRSLSKLPTQMDVEAECRKLFDLYAGKKAPTQEDPLYLFLAGRPHCSLLPKEGSAGFKGEVSQEDCVVETQIIAAMKARDKKICPAQQRERCLFLVSLAAEEENICSDLGKQARTSFCLSDLEQALRKNGLIEKIPPSDLNRITKYWQKVLNRSLE